MIERVHLQEQRKFQDKRQWIYKNNWMLSAVDKDFSNNVGSFMVIYKGTEGTTQF